MHNKDIASKIDKIRSELGDRKTALMFHEIIQFYEGGQVKSKDIVQVDSGEFPIYMFRIDHHTRMVFTQTEIEGKKGILLVDVLER